MFFQTSYNKPSYRKQIMSHLIWCLKFVILIMAKLIIWLYFMWLKNNILFNLLKNVLFFTMKYDKFKIIKSKIRKILIMLSLVFRGNC